MTFDLPPVLANILGPELLVVAGVVVLLFGGSQIPKLARSLGQASKEFKAGQDDVKSEEHNKDGRDQSSQTPDA